MGEIARPFWTDRIEGAWRKVPIVWLAGVRRSGKTTIAREIPDALYLNCDLPSTAERLADPERFFRSVTRRAVIFDEVHQLADPSKLLKIAADEFPRLKVLATGSSTLAATDKFADSLTGRKRVVHLVPVLASELPAFGVHDLRDRMLRGGLPQALLSDERDPEFYSEWMDSYYARDVQELFRVEKRAGFLALLQTLLRQSGGLAEVTALGRASSLARPTVMTYLQALEITQVISILRPYHDGGRQELTHQPKIYAFDTGFVAWSRGWNDLRTDDCGVLWEHVVLETLQAQAPAEAERLSFWRDKQKREIDFVVPRGRGVSDAIECKWSAAAFDPKALIAFRADHPKGRNFVVVPDGPRRSRYFGKLEVAITPLGDLAAILN